MSDVLAMAGVGVVRGDTVILDDVSWEVEEGQRWVVLGPNGAGKTTLLQIAAALTDAVSDTARADRMGLSGRRRAVESFSWGSIGEQTNQVYLDVLRRRMLTP